MELYTSKETMQRLGIGPSTLRHLVKKGRLRRIIQPGKIYGNYSREEVDQLAQARKEFDRQYIIVA